MDIYLYSSKGDVIKLPVVPKSIEIDSPQKNKTFESLGVGDLKIIGTKGNRSFTLSSFFPIKDYPFLKDRRYKGMEYINKIEAWRTEGPITAIISNLNVNFKVVSDSLTYAIQDGSGDIYYSLDLEEYKPPIVIKVTAQSKLKTVPSEAVAFNNNTYAKVTASSLIVRAGKGTGYSSLGTLAKGEKVKVLNFQGVWWQLSYKNKIGYAHSDYLRRV